MLDAVRIPTAYQMVPSVTGPRHSFCAVSVRELTNAAPIKAPVPRLFRRSFFLFAYKFSPVLAWSDAHDGTVLYVKNGRFSAPPSVAIFR
ncbi:MAG: hypothetical protein R6U20_07870 [Longimonas sp.]|uniref:hypothetical protein n=1 Tax=Longimonas sp. TaxID=2039626 RepID=UPI0039762B43